MITAIHTLIYSDDAQATRAFLRDVFGWKYVAQDWDNRINRFAPRGSSVPEPSEMGGCTRRTASGKARLMITRGILALFETRMLKAVKFLGRGSVVSLIAPADQADRGFRLHAAGRDQVSSTRADGWYLRGGGGRPNVGGFV